MNFANGAFFLSKHETHGGADRVGIVRGADEFYAQAAFGGGVMEKFCGGAILGDHKIHTAVVVVIGDGAAALFTVNRDAAFLRCHDGEMAIAVAAQQKAAARVTARRVAGGGEKVLAEENVFVFVAVEIGDGNSEGGGKLSFGGQGNCFEVIAAI